MARNFRGSTDNARSVILGAPFWTKGKHVRGKYLRTFITQLGNDKSGEVHQFTALEPVTLNVDENGRAVRDGKGKEVQAEKFGMGALTGYEMALDDARTRGFQEFRVGDNVTIECTGVKASEDANMSDMLEFSVDIERA